MENEKFDDYIPKNYVNNNYIPKNEIFKKIEELKSDKREAQKRFNLYIQLLNTEEAQKIGIKILYLTDTIEMLRNLLEE